MSSLPYPSKQSSASDHRLNYQSTSLRYNHEIKATLEVKTVVPPPSSRGGGEGAATDDNGVFLTWKDLRVTVSNGKKGSKSILQGLTGYAQPGELLAIMGPSGCGKSTLLDTLAGRLGSNTRQTGDILINGHKQRLAYGTSAYVTQDETLITTLTVKEAVYYSAQLQLPDSMSRAEKKERAEVTIREMGLQDAMNTRIGGWGSKGLSGGQKRRVSICIEILTHPKLLFLDEPTSGLDSAASYYVMSGIVRFDRKDENRRTVIASIHQPSGEVFQLFDSLCLLSAGKVVYFGPASQANEFFALNGFPCPTLQNPSDHFLKTINKDFETDPEQGLEDAITAEVAINTLTKAYKSSDHYQKVKKLVTEICKKDCGTLEERSHSSFLTQCLVLTRRSFVNMYRDLGYYWLRVAIYVSLALGLATLFYNLGSDNDSIQDRGSLLMFIASFLTFMTIGGFPSFVEDMKELDDMKKRLKEMEDEAAALLEMQTKVEKEMGSVQDPSASAAASQANREEVDSRSVFVGNVDYSCTPEEVQQHFQACGTINRVTIRSDKYGQPKGYAYVEFLEPETAQEALLLNESELHGRQLKVTVKRTNLPGMKQFRARRPNPYMGFPPRDAPMPPYLFSPYGYGKVLRYRMPMRYSPYG